MNKRLSMRFGWLGVALSSIAWAGTSRAQNDVVFNFNTLSPSTATGPSAPNGPLVQGADGELYGTTAGAQVSNYGNQGDIFKVSTSGLITVLYTFCTATPGNCTDGEQPTGGLALAGDGNFWGLTREGGSNGNGTIYKVTPQGEFTSVHSFCTVNGCPDGEDPAGSLILGPGGFLYGTTTLGGANEGGVVFKISTAGDLTVLHAFCSGNCAEDGSKPTGTLVLGADGNFYGTTLNGSTEYGAPAGTLFEMTPQGTVTTLYSFCATNSACPDGNYPNEIIQGKDGKLYGTTQQGGTYYAGTVFTYTLASGASPGKFETLYSFCNTVNCPVGWGPAARLVQASDGDFYGTTASGGEPGPNTANADAFGTVFKITAAGEFTSLYTFCRFQSLCPDGFSPDMALMQASNGLLYGGTKLGGMNEPPNTSGMGVIFSQCLAKPMHNVALAQAAAYLGECKSEFTVFRPSTGVWYSLDESGKTLSQQWGISTDTPVLGDYDGDGKSDVAVFRPSNGTWYIVDSSTGTVVSKQWGVSTDIPVLGDFDGDGKSDITVWRPSTGYWYIVQSSNGQVATHQWGESTDVPLVGDFDGDGKSDVAVFRPSTGYWYIAQSSNNEIVSKQWGASSDIPVPGDFDGDGKSDIAVYRPSTGYWYIIQSSNGQVVSKQWGQSGDVPVARDYDGDGKTDIAVWRPSTGDWYVIESSSGKSLTQAWGVSTDIPVNKNAGPP